MNKEIILLKTAEYVQKKLTVDHTGHDWWHVYRVWKMASYIASKMSADQFIVELAALLHDIADWKLHNGDIHAGPTAAKKWLISLAIDTHTIERVCEIILNMSFKGANVVSDLNSLEGFIVQDADRLDAIGAIGVARVFAFGGAFSQPMHEPDSKIELHNSFESYKNKKTTSINHFYEKLLLLKDRMHTQIAQNIAKERHQFMEQFLAHFYSEWNLLNLS